MLHICKLNVNSGQKILILPKTLNHSLSIDLNGFINSNRVFLFIFNRLFF